VIKKLIAQTAVSILIMIFFSAARFSHVEALERASYKVIAHMQRNYSLQSIKECFNDVQGKTDELKECMDNTAAVIAGSSSYGKPIDESFEGDKTPVYAIAGGRVIAVGENEEIGKYVKIVHADQSESLYGNLEKVNVSVPANVKKGQIVGIYNKAKAEEFYYSLNEKD